MPIDPAMLTSGAEWMVPSLDGSAPGVEAGAAAGATGVEGVEGAGSGTSANFGDMLADQLGKLSELQTDAAEASQQLATGQATDPTSVVMAIERAQLAMQLASTVRTKAVDAVNDIFHTTV
ncbi:MAG TPA: flagellar hook-basal body complex protein FliE [Capillimicrobium sp.]|jgi:flagellar hook-basal body complex protein FliE